MKNYYYYIGKGITISIVTFPTSQMLELRYAGRLISNEPDEVSLYISSISSGSDDKIEFDPYKMQPWGENFIITIPLERIKGHLFYFLDNNANIDNNKQKYYKLIEGMLTEKVIGDADFDKALDKFFLNCF